MYYNTSALFFPLQDNKILRMAERTVKLIGLDLDGTLFGKNGKLSDFSIDILKKCRERGIYIVICSGRPLYSIRREISPEYYDFACCMNGQQIISADGSVNIEKRNLNAGEIRMLIRFVEKYSVMMSCSFEDRFHNYCSKKHHIKVALFQHLKNIARRILGRKVWKDYLDSSYDKLPQYEIGKICFSGTPAQLHSIMKELDQNQFTCFLVNPTWLEVMPYGISKGSAFAEVCRLLNIKKEETAALGDGENDLSLLEEAGTAVAMKNCMPSLIKHADMITEYLNTEDGAARWIESNVLMS